MRTISLTCAVCVALVLLGNQAQAQSLVIQSPVYVVGETWTYAGTFISGAAPMTMTVLNIGLSTITLKVQTPDGTLTKDIPRADLVMSNPATLHYPLTVGKRWDLNAQDIKAATGIAEALGEAVVEAEETLTTPAGTFPTLRVRSTVCTHDGCGDIIAWIAPVPGIVKIIASNNIPGKSPLDLLLMSFSCPAC